MIKRISDIFISIIGLILFSPILILLSVFIYLEDHGKVFFVQSRVGLHGKLFKLIKFRTMTPTLNEKKNPIDLGIRSRVTHVGLILRKTKLDELPQLFNVLKGEMSIVGPRPEVPQFMEYYPEKWASVLRVKPGITDYASIEFRNEEEILIKSPNPQRTYIEEILPQKLHFYEKYEKEHNCISDFKIILKTLYVTIFK